MPKSLFRLAAAVSFLALLLVQTGCDDGDDPPPVQAGDVFFAARVLNIAHRGGNRLRPEQTILAWESALALGVDALEMDFRATADGALIMMHDQTVDRTTNGSGRVDELTFAEIRQLDAGYRFTPDGGATYPYRGQGVQVPTLEEVLARFRGSPMNIEIKAENPESVIEPFVALLDKYRVRGDVLVASFSESLMNRFRLAAPDVLTSYTPLEVAQFLVLTPELEDLYEAPAPFLQVPPFSGALPVLTPELVARAHRLGLYVHAWDVDDRMSETIALGVDGLIVDDPAALKALLD
jgi:glycerophosphoryl diester phosphodiesterase